MPLLALSTARGAEVVVDLTTEAASTFAPTPSLGPAGDVNGDGYQDVVLGVRCFNETEPDLAFVAFGPLQPGTHDVSSGDVPGFRIEGEPGDEGACFLSSSVLGDVNGDGLDDVVVGAPRANHGDRVRNGTVYVIFGKTDQEPVSLPSFDADSQGDAGYAIQGPDVGFAGEDLAGLGDVNGDGLADLALGSPFYGTTYVVFGKSDTETVDLATFETGTHGDAGYLIRTRWADESNGYAVGAAGDVNADGIPDVVIGSVGNDNTPVGRAYVVFGKADPEPIDARRLLGTGLGFEIKALYGGDTGGKAVSGAGDVNGDGRDDVLVGMPRDTSYDRGLAFVVFGKKRSAPVKLSELGTKGFRIKGAHRRDAAGNALAAVGDINGDGLDDFLVGARRDQVSQRGQVGAAYLVYGKSDPDRIALRRLTRNQGVRFIGREGSSRTGSTVAGPGDMNGDGIPDIMIGALTGGYSDIMWGRSWED